MVRANIAEFKAKLSYFLRLVKGGEKVVICDRNVPVAELSALLEEPKGKRPIGLHKGLFEVPDAFFEPMSVAELREWYGEEA